MGSDVGQIFPTASLHRDHSISYALVCEKELSHMGKTTEIPIWCAIIIFRSLQKEFLTQSYEKAVRDILISKILRIW